MPPSASIAARRWVTSSSVRSLTLLVGSTLAFAARSRARLTDAVNRREGDPKPFIRGQFHICNTGHILLLALPLAVLGIAANYAHNAATMNDLALHANFPDRRSNFHFPSSTFSDARG